MNSKTITELTEFETLVAGVRGEIMKLDRSKKTKKHYINSGLDAVLSYFHHNNCHDFSKQLLDEMVSERYNDFIHGNAGRFKYRIVRKTAAWLCQFHETGKISQCTLNAYVFKYVSDEYEALISEYISYSLKTGLLTKRQQCCSVKVLIAAGLIKSKKRGMPARRCFRVVKDVDLLKSYLEKGIEKMFELNPIAQRPDENVSTSGDKTAPQVGTKTHDNSERSLSP